MQASIRNLQNMSAVGPRDGIGLLVSVRNAAEAETAIRQGIDILDIKEPSRGSLGRADADTIQQILNVAETGTIVSLALGELPELESIRLDHFLSSCDNDRMIRYAKVGHSNMHGNAAWPKNWQRIIKEIPDYVIPVAVAYADRENAGSPAIETIFERGSEFGCKFAVVDTFNKSAGNIFQRADVGRLCGYRQLANRLGMTFVLAGSIDISVLNALVDIAPQFVGVRGAVCRCADRQSSFSVNAFQQFARNLRHVNRRSSRVSCRA